MRSSSSLTPKPIGHADSHPRNQSRKVGVQTEVIDLHTRRDLSVDGRCQHRIFQCACHPSNKDNPTVLYRSIFKKKKNKKKKKSPANVNITAGHWVVKTSNGTSFQTKVAAFCGQHDGCSRLCSGCVSKWERNMKVEDPVHFQLYSSQKASCKTSAFVVCCYVNPQ